MSDAEHWPRYRCHKEVSAVKIRAIEATDSPVEYRIVPQQIDDTRLIAPFMVPVEYVEKHKPYPGGYLVQYDNGYQSFSPADPFEDGYTRI